MSLRDYFLLFAHCLNLSTSLNLALLIGWEQPHFPDRAAKSVREKWIRSLDPAFVQGTWTQQEDKLLKELVSQYLQEAEKKHQQLESSANVAKKKRSSNKKRRNSNSNGNNRTDDGDEDNDEEEGDDKAGSTKVIPWSQMAKEHFPNRRPEQLTARWNQYIATHEELMQKIKFSLAQECASRGDVIGSGTKLAAQRSGGRDDGNTIDDDDDDGGGKFVLQLVARADNQTTSKKRRKVTKKSTGK